MLHQLGLFVHMVAIIVVAGASIGTMLVENRLLSVATVNPDNAKAMLPILEFTPKMIMIGIMLFLASGVVLLYSVNWVYLTQPWFIIKFVLFISLPVRGVVIGKSTTMQIVAQLTQTPANQPALMALKAKMRRFHIVQFIIVATIIFLVLFKIG